MYIYIIIFFIIAILGASSLNRPKIRFFHFLTISLALGIFVGIADMLGGFDRYVYAQAFEAQSQLIQYKFALMPYFWNEPGYGLLNVIIGYFTPNRYVFIFIISILIFIIFAINIFRNTRYPLFALLLFMGIMFFFTFTYLRQVLAAGILWFAIPYIKNRKFLKFLLIVLLAASFHNSAIIFIPLYFIPLKKFGIRNIILIMFLLLIIGVSGITTKLFALYGDMVGDFVTKSLNYEETSQHGFRIEYLLESTFFLVLLLSNYNSIKDDKLNCVYLNTYLFFCGCLLFFISSSDGGRLSWYFFIGIFTIIPQICTKAISRNFINPLIVLLIFVLYIRILCSWSFLLYPYKTFFSNGYRENDLCYKTYEYDHKYDIDKFYNLSNEKTYHFNPEL